MLYTLSQPTRRNRSILSSGNSHSFVIFYIYSIFAMVGCICIPVKEKKMRALNELANRIELNLIVHILSETVNVIFSHLYLKCTFATRFTINFFSEQSQTKFGVAKSCFGKRNVPVIFKRKTFIVRARGPKEFNSENKK